MALQQLRAESPYVALHTQVEDFMLTTNILPYGNIGEPIKSIRNPGESLHPTQILDVLPKLKYVDRLLLLLHVTLNSMFGIHELSMYDWGYWENMKGEMDLLPYGCHFQTNRDFLQAYTICGVPPTISMLGWCYKDACLEYMRDKMLYVIVQYEKTITSKAVNDPVGWSKFYRILQDSARELHTCIR